MSICERRQKSNGSALRIEDGTSKKVWWDKGRLPMRQAKISGRAGKAKGDAGKSTSLAREVGWPNSPLEGRKNVGTWVYVGIE